MTAPEHTRPDKDRRPRSGCPIRLSVERRLQRRGYAAPKRVSCEFQWESGVSSKLLTITINKT